MNLPAGQLLRFGEILAWTGISERTLREIAATGLLGGRELFAGGRRFYLREICRHVLLGHPLPSLPFGPEPTAELLRVCDVLAWTGLHEKQFRWAERRGLGGGRCLRAGGKKLYPKQRIRADFFTPLLPGGWGQKAVTPSYPQPLSPHL